MQAQVVMFDSRVALEVRVLLLDARRAEKLDLSLFDILAGRKFWQSC